MVQWRGHLQCRRCGFDPWVRKIPEVGNGNPLQCSCLENPRDGGAWWLPSMGSHRVRHDWSDLAAGFKMQYLDASQKWQNDLCSFPRQTIQYHNNPSLCPNQQRWRSWIEQFYEDPQDVLELTLKKRCPFHYRGLECKSRESRNTLGNRQIWPWNMEWSRAKAKRVLLRERTGHSKHPLPTTQEKTLHMDITRGSTPKSDWLYSLQPKMEKLYTVSKNKTRSWLWLRSWTPYWQIQT